MMTTDTKRHIDAARQVLVGVVPNPTSQIDQITNALIYKFMDDMDQAAIKAGGKASFFVGELERYAWTRLMNARVGNQERMNLYVEALAKFSESKKLPDLFREIFKSAFLPYRSPEVLGLFLKEIDFFDYSHPEELGNAYEYLLSIMSSQGDAGQFRTPRHIIDFIVDVVNPTKEDRVLDPACGTGGFLVKSYLHILEQHDGKNPDGTKSKEKPLTPDERRKLMNNFEGYDVDPGMVRIAQVNMYLHQFKNPQIYNYNTLSSEERWGDKFDVMLANPPFMSPKGGVRPHNKFSVQSNRSEVLFVDYIMSHLRPKGRAGIIVPEGIIFQSGTAHKQLRKNLIEDGLYAVVSLPSGVFSPYSGVKTSVLFFDNDLVKKRDEILFIKVESDGFDPGATKRPIDKNDLPAALEILRKWKQGKKIESPRAVYVEKSKIAENGDYNLSGDRYRVATDYSAVKWPMVDLGEIAEVIAGQSPEGKFYNEKGEGTPFYQGKTEFSDKYIGKPTKWTSQVTKLAQANDVLMSVRAPVGPVNLATETICIGRGLAAIRASNKTIPMYLFNVLRRMESEIVGNSGAAFASINKREIEAIKIPLPPLEVQKQIVEELDGYQNIISGARKVVESWKPRIEIDPVWERVRLGDVCDVYGGGTPSRADESFWGGSIPWISSRYFSDEHRITGSEMITEKGLENSSSKIVPKGSTILITRVSVGKFAIADKDYAINQDLTALVPKGDNLDGNYLWLISEIIANKIKENAVGVGVTGVTRDFVVNQEIPLPSLEIQKAIVEKIEAERALIEANKKLIEIYEGKTKEAISKLWNE